MAEVVKDLTVFDDVAETQRGEPSVATSGDIALYTGNFFAAVSTDDWGTVRYLDIPKAFSDGPAFDQDHFCDQTAHYIPSLDIFVWLFLIRNQTGNLIRIAYLDSDGMKLDPILFRYQDIAVERIGFATPNLWLDRPDAVVGTDAVYVSVHAYDSSSTLRASAVLRYRFDTFSDGWQTPDGITQEAASDPDMPDVAIRLVENCQNGAIWAGQKDLGTLRVYTWPANSPSATHQDVSVPAWSEAAAGRPDPSITPDSFNWLGTADYRISGATQAGSTLWFCWMANADPAVGRPVPYTRVVRIDASAPAYVSFGDAIDLWDAANSISFATLATNVDREVAVSFMIGGPTSYPYWVLGFLTEPAGYAVPSAGDISACGPSANEWGDYLGLCCHYPDKKLFSAGVALLGTPPGQPVHLVARYKRFGRP